MISFAWANELAAMGHRVVLASRGERDSVRAEGAGRMLPREVVDLSMPYRPSLNEIIRLSARRLPSAAIRIGTGWVTRDIRRMEAVGFLPHAVVVVGPALVGALDILQRAWKTQLLPVVMFVPYDSVYLSLLRRREHDRGLRAVWNGIQRHLWRSAERDLFCRSDACVLVTPTDAKSVAREWERVDGLHVVTNGVDTGYFSPVTGEERRDTVSLSGNLWAADTDEAVHWFLREVWPEVRRQKPGAVAELVGRDPSDALREIAPFVPGVRLIGSVADIRPYVGLAAVYVLPVRSGTGIKNRMLEAMALQRAIVATSTAAAGTQAEAGLHFRLADEPLVMANEIVHLLNSPTDRTKLGRAARALVERAHSWRTAAREVERILVAEIRHRTVRESTNPELE